MKFNKFSTYLNIIKFFEHLSLNIKLTHIKLFENLNNNFKFNLFL